VPPSFDRLRNACASPESGIRSKNGVYVTALKPDREISRKHKKHSAPAAIWSRVLREHSPRSCELSFHRMFSGSLSHGTPLADVADEPDDSSKREMNCNIIRSTGRGRRRVDALVRPEEGAWPRMRLP
jgi:hypothetical protein